EDTVNTFTTREDKTMKTLTQILVASAILTASASFAGSNVSQEETVVAALPVVVEKIDENATLFDKQAFKNDIRDAIMQSAKQIAMDALLSSRTYIAAN